MAGMTLDEFEHRVIAACSNSSAVQSIALNTTSETTIRFRIVLVDNSFIDVFFNEKLGKASYAVIKNGSRIFGADNTGGWHWHPREDPSDHVPAGSAITFEEFLEKVEKGLE
ncbi:MAG: hypothetical protein AB1846_15565 [Chloroflexota bacterium]